jgi:molybdopterin molybdotransferase
MLMSLEKALQSLLEAIPPPSAERVHLDETVGRTLAEIITAPCDYPLFDRSPLDGYAVRCAETAQATPANPAVLKIMETVFAGDAAQFILPRGHAAPIAAGAPVPDGADGVIPGEAATCKGAYVHIYRGQDAAKNICFRGEDIRKGASVLEPGTRISSNVISLLAAMGQNRPLVCKRPRIALISIGSELAPAGAPLRQGMIYNANIHAINALTREAGGTSVLKAMVRDDEEDIVRALRVCAEQDFDVCVTTGGASAGKKDLTEKSMIAFGIKMLFTGVGAKPGMPVMAGINDQRIYIGLSGNPSAANAAFELLVRPVLLRLGGRRDCERVKARARLLNDYPKATDSFRYVWARCKLEGNELVAEILQNRQGSKLKFAQQQANALLSVPAGSPPLSAGTELDVMLLLETH